MADEPGCVRIGPLVAVDEAERDERSEDERLDGGREEVGALQGGRADQAATPENFGMMSRP